MTVKVSIKTNLTQQDWDTYKKIWQESYLPNPFLAPSILQQNNTATLLLSFIYLQEKLIGVLPFNLNNSALSVAGEKQSDVINFLFLPNVPTYTKQKAFIETFKNISFTSFFSGKLADDSLEYLLIAKALKQQGFKTTIIKSLKNPLVKFKDSEYSDEVFLKVFSKRNTRNYCNKLRKNFGYEITAIQEFEENKVKAWLDVYYEYHIARWNATDTPSMYSQQENRDFFYNRVKAWIEDKVGTLFSVDVEGKPMALAVCLKKGETIIYHQISSSGEDKFSKYPKHKILILELVKWMLENGFKSLDFGVGKEPYKYEYANKDPYTLRIYGAKSIASKQYVKGVIDHYYQNSPKTQELLNGKIRPAITKAKTKIELLKAKVAINLKEANGNYLKILKKAIRKSKPNTEHFYQYAGAPQIKNNENVKLAKVSMQDMLEFYEQEIILTPKKRLHYVNALTERTKEPWGLYKENNELAAIAWLAEPAEKDTPPIEGIENLKIIKDCFTAQKHRGNGYYPALISRLAEQEKASPVMIYTNDWNKVSQKGIIKAGFKEVITRKTTGEKYEWKGRK